MSGLYRLQRGFFRKAYVSGTYGWPETGATPEVAELVGRLGRKKGRTALDLGCGTGRHTILLAKRGYAVTALDYEPLALKKARAAVRRAGVRARFTSGDALALRLPKGAFDLVLDYGCFHHVRKRDWKTYRDNVVRVLKPGGHLMVSVFSTKFRHHHGDRRTRPWVVHHGHYDRFFTPRSFREALARSFDNVDVIEEHKGLKGFLHGLWRVRQTAKRRTR